MKFRFHPAALEEYEESALYYAAISPLLARRFVRVDGDKCLRDVYMLTPRRLSRGLSDLRISRKNRL